MCKFSIKNCTAINRFEKYGKELVFLSIKILASVPYAMIADREQLFTNAYDKRNGARILHYLYITKKNKFTEISHTKDQYTNDGFSVVHAI